MSLLDWLYVNVNLGVFNKKVYSMEDVANELEVELGRKIQIRARG
jgi:hypothetical protein